MSAGFNEVLREDMVDVGVCMDRILDRVDRNRRRMRCGTRMCIEGHDSGILETEKKRWVESSPPREKYWVGMSLEGERRREVVVAALQGQLLGRMRCRGRTSRCSVDCGAQKGRRRWSSVAEVVKEW